jgi:hypothetical protein
VRATVFGVAVASLVAVGRLPGQGGGAGLAGQDTARRADAPAAQTPVSDTIRFGRRVIESGRTVTGPVLVAAGDLRVRGTIEGTAIAIAGDIVVETGGRITGDAIAALGRVRLEGGRVEGQPRAYAASFGWVPRDAGAGREREVRSTTGGALGLSLGWLVMTLLIGIGVLVFAAGYLEGVSDVLEQSFWRSFRWGVAGQLATIPVLVLLLIALAVTVVGILLIPFAVVAYVLAVAGLCTLGFLAMARLTGGALRASRAAGLSARGSALRGLVVGITLFLGMWVIAAAFQWSPITSGLLRTIAFAITWVAVTAGFGAAILSRGGTRRDTQHPKPVSEEMAVWQTPTPVTGVVAARRPTPAIPRERV